MSVGSGFESDKVVGSNPTRCVLGCGFDSYQVNSVLEVDGLGGFSMALNTLKILSMASPCVFRDFCDFGFFGACVLVVGSSPTRSFVRIPPGAF